MTVVKTFIIRIPFCPEDLSADQIQILIYDDLAVDSIVKEVK